MDTIHAKRFYNTLTLEQKKAFELIISDIDLVNELSEEIRTRQKDIVDKIVDEFVRITKIPFHVLNSKSRNDELVMLRTCLSVWLYNYTGLTVEQVGKILNRDHATISRGINHSHPLFKKNSGLYRTTYAKLHEAGIKIIRQTEIQNQIKEEQ